MSAEVRMSEMKLEIVACPKNPLNVIFSHFYGMVHPGEVYQDIFNKDMPEEEQIAFLCKAIGTNYEEKLWDSFSQVAISLSVTGISRYLSESIIDLEDHTAISKQSQRYVTETRFKGAVPALIANNAATIEICANRFNSVKEEYEALMAEGVKSEDARNVLPQAAETSLACTATVAAWLEKMPYLFTSFNSEARELGWQLYELFESLSLGDIVNHVIGDLDSRSQFVIEKDLAKKEDLKKEVEFVTAKASVINITDDGWKLVYSAFRQCYSKDSVSELMGKVNSGDIPQEKATAFIKKIMGSGHVSAVEHEKVTFEVEGLSSPAYIQWSRHRIANFCIKEINYDDIKFIIPPSIKKSEKATAIYTKMCSESLMSFYQIRDALISAGVSLPEANMAATYVLPNAIERCFTVTMNTRTLIDFLMLRLCVRAQWEIRGLAKEMLIGLGLLSAVFFKDKGAFCDVYGYCPENEKFSCGAYPRLDQILDFYNSPESQDRIKAV